MGAGKAKAALLPGLCLAAGIAMSAAAGDLPGPAGATLRPLAFSDIAGWASDDHAAAFRAFRATCLPIVESRDELRRAKPASSGLVAACRSALALTEANARAFFERAFAPFEVIPASGRGFLTGYYEPEVAGSRTTAPGFSWPIYARPTDLATRGPDEPLAGIDPDLAAARRTPTGFEPMPDRAAIEAGALGGEAKPLLYVRDEVEAFFIHVQGSARIKLNDGSVARLAYAGRNGHAYTSVGRLLVTEFGLTPEDVTLEKLKAWLRAHPDEGRALMRRNRSFIFFRIADELDPKDGPIGGAGAPLQPDRSLAVDRELWSYGLPVFIDADVPAEVDPAQRIARLVIAQDTGSAIVGPARGDLFFGAGEEMGRRAGALRHAARFIVLLPRADGAP
ncbi:murein transglycosylase A [Terrarubrum flagellatum]|uniref:murein transglycosylase A n=1 Tax=Terrirubrum flagellatum TaxID=2895980 RepID=UPI00314513C2